MKPFILLGIWRAVLLMQGQELPFNFEMIKTDDSYQMIIRNGLEKITVDELSWRNDSLIIRLPVYDSEIHAWIENGRMQGTWYNFSRSDHREIPFMAIHGVSSRFKIMSQNPAADFNGRWACYFRQSEKDSSLAIGLFEQSGRRVNGTFMTSVGDYRFLEGVADGDSLKLSYFDGAFAYLFLARKINGTISGKFFSGQHYQASWNGYRNDTLSLPDPYSLSRLKPGINTLSFRFPDTDSNWVEYPSRSFQGRVMVIQISGSWCPNCVDESRYFAWLKANHQHLPVEFIGLMFERTSDFQKARQNIRRFKSFTGANYPLLFAGDRKNFYQLLPQFEKLAAYPTTLLIDKRGLIRYIHTGFNGPATGIYFVKQKEEFERQLFSLIQE
jgi:peroxiredoxin